MTDTKVNPTRDGMLNIPGDTVNQATKDLPDEQRSAIRWLHSHALESGWTLEETAAAIRKNKNTLYQVFTGRHQAGKSNIVEEIIKLRQITAARAGTEKLAYIETALSRKIWTICEAALTYQRIGFIYGDSQIGKTTALREYQRTHNHGETIMVTVPAGGAMGDFLAEMAHALRISSQLKQSELKRRIISAFDDRMLLIVDEAHQALGITNRSDRMGNIRVLEFVRELHDRSRCGVIISATNVFRSELEQGRAAGILKQLKRRRLTSLQLPDVPTRKDLNTFANAYGLDPAEDEALELQTDVIKNEALGVWLTLLRMTAARCARKSEAMNWDQVILSHDQLRKLEG